MDRINKLDVEVYPASYLAGVIQGRYSDEFVDFAAQQLEIEADRYPATKGRDTLYYRNGKSLLKQVNRADIPPIDGVFVDEGEFLELPPYAQYYINSLGDNICSLRFDDSHYAYEDYLKSVKFLKGKGWKVCYEKGNTWSVEYKYSKIGTTSEIWVERNLLLASHRHYEKRYFTIGVVITRYIAAALLCSILGVWLGPEIGLASFAAWAMGEYTGRVGWNDFSTRVRGFGLVDILAKIDIINIELIRGKRQK